MSFETPVRTVRSLPSGSPRPASIGSSDPVWDAEKPDRTETAASFGRPVSPHSRFFGACLGSGTAGSDLERVGPSGLERERASLDRVSA